eukprot:g21027.t1
MLRWQKALRRVVSEVPGFLNPVSVVDKETLFSMIAETREIEALLAVIFVATAWHLIASPPSVEARLLRLAALVDVELLKFMLEEWIGTALNSLGWSRGSNATVTGAEILRLIDQRFEELEETVALAGLVPQLHDRLHVLEKKMILDTQTNEYYSFGESTWDLVFFIGTGALGPGGSFQTCLLAVVNVLMQVVFVAIAYFNFTTAEVNDQSVVDATRWRRSSGHSLSTYSELARASLTTRVCSLDKSLEQSGIQVDLYENIDKYLKAGREGFESYFTGQMLCIVALICWYLMVAKEVSHALALHRSIVATPTGATRIDTRENPFTQVRHYRLRTVAKRRKVFSFCLFTYRVVSAGLLVFVGTFFLVYTFDVTELILNAVALGIILDIDDLLFDALATTPGRHLVHQLDPLPMPSMPRLRGADAKSVCMSIFIPALTIFVYFTMLGPMVATLEEVSLAMCGGNQDFVWDLDPRGVVLMSPTPGGGFTEDTSIKSLAVDEAQEVGIALGVNDTQYSIWLQDVTQLSGVAVLTLAESLDLNNPQCIDLASDGYLTYLRFLLGDATIQGCEDVINDCGSFTRMPEYQLDGGKGWAARMLCSQTCGCQDPASGQISVQGCPYGAGRPCASTEAFQDGRFCGFNCLGVGASEKLTLNWGSCTGMQAYGEMSADLAGKAEALKIAQAMWDYGCGFGAELAAQNVSWGTCFGWNSTFEWEFKTVEAFCPVSCQCSANTKSTACPEPFGYSCDELEAARHMDAALLWIQQKEKEKILAVSPIPTELNSDDISAGTKGLTRSRLFGLLYMLKMVDGAGDRVGHEEYRELEHSERMRKGTQKVLKNKNLHVGLIWLPSNLESVAGAPTEEANSEGSDSWQWIWLVCTVVGALSLIEWLRRYLPKVIYMTWNYTEVAFSEMIRETTKYKSEEKGMDDKAAQTDNWVDFEALAHCEVERNEMENKVFQLDTYIEELESEICKVKEQRDMALQEETFIEAKLATRGLFGRVQALLQDQCLPRKRVCLLAGFTNTFDGTLACKLTTRDENFVAPLMPDIRASMRKMIEHFSGMPADYMHYTPVKINRQVIEIFTFYEVDQAVNLTRAENQLFTTSFADMQAG